MLVTRQNLLIRLSDRGYPLTLEEVRQENPLVTFGDSLDEMDLQLLGYAPVHDTERPEGDVVVEVAPVEESGQYRRAYAVRSFNEHEAAERLNEQKGLMVAQLEAVRDDALAVGMPFTVDDYGTGQSREIHVQLRVVDRLNLLALKGEADYYVSQNEADQLMEFRPYENITVHLTADQMVNLCHSALGAMKRVYTRMWQLKDQVDKAASVEQFPSIPDSFFA